LTTSVRNEIGCLRLLVVAPAGDLDGRLHEAIGADADILSCADLADLRMADLDDVDLVISAVHLHDGSGLEVPEIVREIGDVPVVIACERPNGGLISAAIASGALDVLVLDDAGLARLPHAIDKCLAHHRVRQHGERLTRALRASVAEFERRNEQLIEVIGQLERKARTDDLTGLANRRWLNVRLESEWAEATRTNLPLACIMIDLDCFKQLNDEHGHQRGDALLGMVGRVIQANCRHVDVAARYGGDEFCILMPHTAPSEAVMVAERILRAFETAMDMMPGGDPRVGMSIGVAHREVSRPCNADELLAHADEALYEAKALGKKRVVLRDACSERLPDRQEASFLSL